MSSALTPVLLKRLVHAAESAARAAGKQMRQNLDRPKAVHLATQHDVKLELDVRCQKIITSALQKALPEGAILGEEGIEGNVDGTVRWVIDPIDGTVNFTYGVPHACVSIALQERTGPGSTLSEAAYADGYVTRLGVVFDPFTNELWCATDSGPATLNGRRIRVAQRTRLSEAIVALGFAKGRRALNRMLPVFERLTHKVRKLRIMGAAALSTTYVASGRFDAYVESGVRLWDIAAGGLIVQRAGGTFWRRELDKDRTYEILVSAPQLQRPLIRLSTASNP
ncbi:MAG: inositol monophosphatase [Verrucomicrobiales bacterium]|nr:inositol monophosphatase [Verrucomicrobiales bacterium]